MSHCYIGRAECGCIVAGLVDNPEHKKEVAKQVADFIRDGLTIERHPTEDVRKMVFGHKCK